MTSYRIGGVYYPWVWYSTNTPNADEIPIDFKYDMKIPVPLDHCIETQSHSPYHCFFSPLNGGPFYDHSWFTDQTRAQGEHTLPDYMYDEYSAGGGLNHPFVAPGTARSEGDGCGVAGGNPPCKNQNPKCPACRNEPYGTRCNGGYSRGRPALEHAAEGLFDQAPYTYWYRGQPADVYWYAIADHRGVYSYRLCKVS